jgi:hypothetical protein
MQPTPLQPPSPLNYDDERRASTRSVEASRAARDREALAMCGKNGLPFFKRSRKFCGYNAPWRNRFSGGRATLFAVRSRRCGQRCCSGVHRSHCLPTPRDTPSAPLLGSGTPRSGVPHMAYGLARRGRLDAAPLNRPRAVMARNQVLQVVRSRSHVHLTSELWPRSSM